MERRRARPLAGSVGQAPAGLLRGMSAYPPPPWRLRGRALFSVQLVKASRVRPLVPPPFRVVCVFPGLTVGGLYVAAYGAGSALDYHELAVIPALVRYGRRRGGWVSHIYVDDTRSVAGGLEVWGLPKELAEFRSETRRWQVAAGNRVLCEVSPGRALPLGLWTSEQTALTRLESGPAWFTARIRALLRVGIARWMIPHESPFAGLGLSGSRLTIHLSDLDATVCGARPV